MILWAGKRDTGEDMRRHLRHNWPGFLVTAGLLLLDQPVLAQEASDGTVTLAAGADRRSKIAQYVRARGAYETEAGAYWQLIADKRRARMRKLRNGEPIEVDDYVLSQPPLYSGPPRPPGYVPPRDPAKLRLRIPVVADFLNAAAVEFRFMPQRPQSETAFKEAYARAAAAAGLTQEQVVRIYAFETGGNGTYDAQAGLTSRRKGARAISPALGYNQLLNTNTIGLLAEHGDNVVGTLEATAATLSGNERKVMEQKIAGLQRMIAFSRTVPFAWSEHDRLAKTTRSGVGIHAAVLDRDIGPLLQTRKLLDSVMFARGKGVTRPLTAVELQMMNFTGDGSGIDMVLMPQSMRERVPTANFFQRGGYERNPIARRTGTVAALFAAIEAKMDRASKAQGARDLAAAFYARGEATAILRP
jgi:hypothetical protein